MHASYMLDKHKVVSIYRSMSLLMSALERKIDPFWDHLDSHEKLEGN
jgi:hypothetical protein